MLNHAQGERPAAPLGTEARIAERFVSAPRAAGAPPRPYAARAYAATPPDPERRLQNGFAAPAPEQVTQYPRLAIIDHHRAVMESLVTALATPGSFELAWTASDPAAGIKCFCASPPDVLVLDLVFDGQPTGLDLLQGIRSTGSTTPIVLFSGITDSELVARALAAGANVFVSKGARLRDLEEALVALAGRPTHGRLTPREEEVLSAIRSGLTNSEIASRLGVTSSTINKHVDRILKKTGTRNRAQAAARAFTTKSDQGAGPAWDRRWSATAGHPSARGRAPGDHRGL